jgi:CHAD domain-containing protein
MRQNTAGCIRGRDIEFMHDYRVAIRKTRVVLKQLELLYPLAIDCEFKKFFSKLGQLTNPVRDLDVFLYELESYQPVLEKSVQKQLQSLRDYLLNSRASAQKTLIKELESPQYRASIKQWRDFLETSESFKVDNEANNPDKAIYQISDKLLLELNQQTVVEGLAISDSSEAETMHDLRKSFKKLRYMIDFFCTLYPVGILRELSLPLVDVQDNLGVFNDSHVQISILNEFIKQSDNEQAIKASEQIINILNQQLLKAGESFKGVFAVYSSDNSQNKFKELFVDYYGSKK